MDADANVRITQRAAKESAENVETAGGSRRTAYKLIERDKSLGSCPICILNITTTTADVLIFCQDVLYSERTVAMSHIRCIDRIEIFECGGDSGGAMGSFVM